MSICAWSRWASALTASKHPLGLVEGCTENTSVLTDLLTGLGERDPPMPFDLVFLFVGIGAIILLVGLLVMLGRGGVRTGRPRRSKHRK